MDTIVKVGLSNLQDTHLTNKQFCRYAKIYGLFLGSLMFDYIKSQIASTDFGKLVSIKPKLRDELGEARKELKLISKQFDPVVLANAPQLHKVILSFRQCANELLDELEHDDTLDIIADIVGKKIKEHKSVDEFLAKLEGSKAINEMKQFVSSLIDIENYTKLSQVVVDAKNFKQLTPEKQNALCKLLEDKQLIEAIRNENAKLNIEQIKANVVIMAQSLALELGVADKDLQNIIAIFNRLAANYLPKFDTIRCELLERLPTFFDLELQRLRAKQVKYKVSSLSDKSIRFAFKGGATQPKDAKNWQEEGELSSGIEIKVKA